MSLRSPIQSVIGLPIVSPVLHATVSAAAFTAAAMPSTRTWSGSDSDWATVASPFTCNPSGSTAPYTYVWTAVSTTGDPGGISLDGALGKTLTGVSNFLEELAPTLLLKCTVTDAAAKVAVSNNVTVSA